VYGGGGPGKNRGKLMVKVIKNTNSAYLAENGQRINQESGLLNTNLEEGVCYPS